MHEIRELVEIWQDHPAIEQADHIQSLRVAKSVVVHPGTTQCVYVSWPVLGNDEFLELSEQGVLWEFYVSKAGMNGELDETCAQLVRGIAPLRVGQHTVACKGVLF